jgi:hypothetical protein
MECVLIKCKDFARLFSTKWVGLYRSEVISLMLLRREIMLCRCQKSNLPCHRLLSHLLSIVVYLCLPSITKRKRGLILFHVHTSGVMLCRNMGPCLGLPPCIGLCIFLHSPAPQALLPYASFVDWCQP